MTCYNAQDTIERALEGALKQDWPHFEIVIVDDCSQDKSISVIEEKIKHHDHVRLVVHKENKGFPAALNSMIKNASGEFIAIFDDDDESRENRLSCQYEAIINYERETKATLLACYASGVMLYDNGYRVPFRAIGSQPKVPAGACVADYLLFFEKEPGMFFGGGTPSCALMARQTTFVEVGFYDESLRRAEDADFSIRLALKGGHFIGCPEDLLVRHSTAGEDKNPDMFYEGYCALFEKHRDYLEGKNRYDYAHGWLKMKYHHFARQPLKAFWDLMFLIIKHPVWTGSHFCQSAPRRLIHEWKVKRKSVP